MQGSARGEGVSFTFGSLFSGIGGIDLGLERAGMQCKWQVEKDAFCQKVLAKHWPDVARYGDVRECGRDNLIGVDLIAGGFPCQPHSLAGDRQASSDERDLWPEFYRIIRELKPRWVLGENVLGLLSSEDGAFFGGVLRDLAEAGYDAEWCVLRASDVGAPHQRERVFLVAHASSVMVRTGADFTGSMGEAPTGTNCEGTSTFCDTLTCGSTSVAYSSSCGQQECQNAKWLHNQFNSPGAMADANGQRQQEWHTSTGNRDAGLTTGRVETRPTSGLPQSCLGRVLDGLSCRLDGCWPAGPATEIQEAWEPSRVILNKFLPNRTNRLKVLGNAVVPQLAEAFGYCILESEKVA